MSMLNNLIDWLEHSAEDNLESAYAALGAKPGPGIDIEVYPTQPMDGTWKLNGQTKAGRAFVAKFWANPLIETNHQLAVFKRQAEEWGLKYKIIVKFESLDGEKHGR